jgi:predicted Zn-dependent protease
MLRKVSLFLTLTLFTSIQIAFAGGLFAVSPNDERKVGAEAAREIEKKERIIGGAFARRVKRIGERLVRGMDNPQFDYSFKVIDNEQVNAFALPGGYVYVYTGLEKTVTNDDELASVLAHEIIHAEHRHWARAYEKSQERRAILGAALSVFKVGDVGRVAASVYDYSRQQRYSRQEESEADRDGMALMPRAGFDVWGMVSMLENLSQFSRSQPKLLAWTASHPSAEERVNAARQQAQNLTGSRASEFRSDNRDRDGYDDNNRPRRRRQRR